MSASLFLIIRLAIVIALYLFLGWALYSLWLNIRTEEKKDKAINEPGLTLNIENNEQIVEKKFNKSKITIGRHPKNDLQLSSTAVSATHATIYQQDNQWWLEDLNSKNGTFLNDIQISSRVVITNGDKIRMGDVILTITREKIPSGEEEK